MGYDDWGNYKNPPLGNTPPPKDVVIISPPGDPPKGIGGEPESPTGEGYFAHPGLDSTSKRTGRTVNGQIEMVTASGKIWLWNGKTNKVLVLNVANRQQYAAVRQGDPDIRTTAVVDGKRYNVASPAYAEAISKKQAAQAPKEPTLPPGPVCAGWGCPKPGPRTSTIEQEGGGQKPKSPASTTKFGGVNAGGSWQPANSPATAAKPHGPAALLNRFGAFGGTKQQVNSQTKVAAPAAATPLSAPQVPAYRGLPQSQQYKFQNKQF